MTPRDERFEIIERTVLDEIGAMANPSLAVSASPHSFAHCIAARVLAAVDGDAARADGYAMTEAQRLQLALFESRAHVERLVTALRAAHEYIDHIEIQGMLQYGKIVAQINAALLGEAAAHWPKCGWWFGRDCNCASFDRALEITRVSPVSPKPGDAQ